MIHQKEDKNPGFKLPNDDILALSSSAYLPARPFLFQ